MKRSVVLALAVSGILLAAALLAGFLGSAPNSATAASHREAPLISLDPAADNTDTFFFRSYEPGNNQGTVVMVMNVIPNEEPSSGPNYYNFDPNVRYSFNIDNNQDGKAEDVVVSFDFKTEIRGVVDALGLPLSYIGGAGPVPPITALDGPGSEGLGLRQKYSVTIEKSPSGPTRTTPPLKEDLIAVPSNVGPRTMPNYDALAEQGIYDLGNGIRVFAGQRNDPFYIDVGAAFDTLNLRRQPPLLTAIEDMNDDVNPFGFDQLSGFSVHTIAIEMPARMLTSDQKGAEKTGSPKLGMYASTNRPEITVRGPEAGVGLGDARGVQVSRLANPLVNELIIGTKDKDEWNASDPDEEEKFVGYYLKPRFALALELAFGFPTGCSPFGTPACSPNPPAPAADLGLSNFNRDDLVNILLKYAPSDTNLSELLRLDVSVDPVPLRQQKRLSILAGDMAGWPNGRRPKDDVTDIATRVVGGPLYITNRAGDGVNTDLSPLPRTFPFVPRPSDGRDLNPEPHVDPTP